MSAPRLVVTHRPREKGAIIAILAIILVPLLILIAFSLSLGGGENVRAQLKAVVDDAATSSASIFCSTRHCYNVALIAALETIRNANIEGQNGHESFVAACDTAIAQLNAELADPSTQIISGPGGNFEWNLDGVKVQIERGRWWLNQQIPNSVPPGAVYNNTSFESFDREAAPGVPWQLWHSGPYSNVGTPSFFAANAVRILIRREDYRSVFMRAFTAPFDIEVESIASRLGKATGNATFCSAPFAFPVCALLNDLGEFDPKSSCGTDRYFTEIRRFCPVNGVVGAQPLLETDYSGGWTDYNSCNVLPGSWWSPISKDTYCDPDPTKPWYSAQRCECASSLSEAWIRGIVPCGQKYGQAAMSCTFYPWATFNEPSDHYGVVGLGEDPSQGYDDATWEQHAGTENYYFELFSQSGPPGNPPQICQQRNEDGTKSDVDGTYPFTIGTKFHFKKSGLTNVQTDASLWKQITAQGTAYTQQMKDRYHPFHYDPTNTEIDKNGFKDMGWWWFSGRIDDRYGYPAGYVDSQNPGELNGLLTQLESQGYIEPTGVKQKAHECYQPTNPQVTPAPQWGACGSKISWYDNRCQRDYHSWYVPSPLVTDPGPDVAGDRPGFAGTKTGWSWSGSLFTNPNGYSYPESRSSQALVFNESGKIQGDPNGNQWNSSYSWGAGSPPAAWNCGTAPPQMPCPANSGDPTNYNTPENTRLWNTLVPVIADVSSGAQKCTGVAGGVGPDPHIDPRDTWIIIGFVRTYIYDDDIGADGGLLPPPPPGTRWESGAGYYNDPNAPGSGNLPDPNPAPSPPVCDYDKLVPWMFNPNYTRPSTYTEENTDSSQSRSCDIVRARTACNVGLVAGDFHGNAFEAVVPPSIVYAR